MENYKLSVVIPCYNEKNSIHEIIEKILASPIANKDIIIVDDKGDPYLLDASMSGGKVMLEPQPLFKFLEKSKTNIGIRVFRMMQ